MCVMTIRTSTRRMGDGERATYLIRGAEKRGVSARYEDVQFIQGQCGDYQRQSAW